jgi:hypothetical protein
MTTEVIITCERDRYEAKVEEPGSLGGAFQASGEYDTPLGAVVSLAARLFDNWIKEMEQQSAEVDLIKEAQPVWTPEHGLHQGTEES